jgi:soluble lytic murein transglycosylase-like protein
MRRAILLGVAILFASAMPARAELVYFASGRALSVKAIRSNGSNFILYLRGGGQIECDQVLITKVEPDEVEYPDEVLDALPFAKSLREAPAVPEQYRALVETTARTYGVDPRLVGALIQVESAYHSRATSPKGAKGLMQLMPATGRQYGALDLYDPKINIDAGVRHLKSLLSRYELPLALAAYNAGAGAVEKFNGIPPFRETQDYVARILRLFKRS